MDVRVGIDALEVRVGGGDLRTPGAGEHCAPSHRPGTSACSYSLAMVAGFAIVLSALEMEKALQKTAGLTKTITTLARAEGLEAHARSVEVRDA